jgi:hypothetical protein
VPPPRPQRQATGQVAPRRPRSGNPLCPLGETDSPGAATPVDSGAPLGAGSSSVASRAWRADVSDRSGATPSALSGPVSVIRAANVCSGLRRPEASASAGSKPCPSPCVCGASPADPAPPPTRRRRTPSGEDLSDRKPSRRPRTPGRSGRCRCPPQIACPRRGGTPRIDHRLAGCRASRCRPRRTVRGPPRGARACVRGHRAGSAGVSRGTTDTLR